MSLSLPIYEIYAVKYAGPLTSSVAMVFWNTDWEKKIERNYYLWVIRGGGETLIVDCGVSPPLAKERKIPGYINPVGVLERIGIKASRVKKLIITHVNFDHISGIPLFPKATFYMRRTRQQTWT